MSKLISTNPAKNYQKIGEVKTSSSQEVKAKVKQARLAQPKWQQFGLAKRLEYLAKAMDLFKANQEKIAQLITKEVGTPIEACRDEVWWNFDYWQWFKENAQKILVDEVTHEDEKTVHKIIYEPMGVAAVITPWNLPFDLFFWGVIPNLLVGNTVVFKISEECPLAGKLFEEILNQAKLPKDVFSEVYGNGKVGEQLVNEDIDLIWFTGSSKVGQYLAEIASRKFIKGIFEMGGSNPGIVFEDTDVDSIINKVYGKRFNFCGQTCDALKRLLVHKSKFNEVVTKLKTKVEQAVVGNPEDKMTMMGPLVAKRQLKLLADQVADAVKKGAKIITGGKQPKELSGAYYEPTILTNVKDNMRVWGEEVFGPVLIIRQFATEAEAIKLANDSVYGLGALVFTHDKTKADRVARLLKSGTVEINAASHWQPFNPFGGYKHSGMGKEHGVHGLRELCQIKVISAEK